MATVRDRVFEAHDMTPKVDLLSSSEGLGSVDESLNLAYRDLIERIQSILGVSNLI